MAIVKAPNRKPPMKIPIWVDRTELAAATTVPLFVETAKNNSLLKLILLKKGITLNS